MLMDKSMIDATSEGALMDKTLVVARQLISYMIANYQQFGTRVAATSKVIANEVSVSMVADNQRLENKLTELTSLVRQLAIGQQ